MKIKKVFGLLLVLSLLWTSTAYAALPDQPVSDTPEDLKTDEVSHRLIVELASPPLALWAKDTPDLFSLDGKLNVASPSARAYVDRLKVEQAAFVQNMTKMLPEATVSSFTNEMGVAEENAYQIVFNGVAIDPGSADPAAAARLLEQLPEVKRVYPDRAHTPQLYTSTHLINAPAMWNALGGREDAGEGVMFASVDGGVHHAAPMFDGTGYGYPTGYPKGYEENTNGKIIVSRAYFRTWDPPAAGDDNPWPGESGTPHGVHTASIAAGDVVTADLLSLTFPNMSGVAPKAYVMSYRVFYNSVAGIVSAWDAELIAALEDVVTDGADVVNNSWGGGPGSAGGEYDALDTALTNAVEAGVFVSMSAGNAGPGYGTGDHPSDPYISVAAVQSGGAISTGKLNVIEPDPDLEDIPFTLAAFGPPPPIGEIITYTYKAAVNVDPDNVEGCAEWPDGTFEGVAAVISRGTCEFGQKVFNAQEAGAEFVVIYNDEAGGDELINMGGGVFGPQVTIASVFVGHSDGLEIVEKQAVAEAAGEDAVLELDFFTAEQVGNTPDIVADFSSRGPGVGSVLKPDIAAPGVNILAQGYAPGETGEDRHLGYGQASGTSMASPHVAGGAALLTQMHPGWTPADIKSALMSTAKFMHMYNQDGTPAQPLDMGAGRIDLEAALDPGVLLDPPSVSFGSVMTGTYISFPISVTNVATSTETYAISTLYTGHGFAVTETTAFTGVTVSPETIMVAPGATEVFTVTFDATTSMGVGDNQGYIILESDLHDAHMPGWARVLPEPADADVLIIDSDFSYLLGYPDYTGYYTDALDELGLSYEIWDADAHFANPATIPDAAVLSAYDTVLLFTGDHYQPDGTFTVSTPFTQLDMDRLTEYANQGGHIIAMGQDLASVLNSAATEQGTFFYTSILGGNWLQDDILGDPTDLELPEQRIVPLAYTPAGFQGVAVDLSAPEFFDAMGTFSADAVVKMELYMPVIMKGGAMSSVAAAPALQATQAVTGTATFDYEGDSDRLDYTVNLFVDAPTTVTAVALHQGAMGENGPMLYMLLDESTTVTDMLMLEGSLLLEPAEAEAFLAEELYVLVRTEEMPLGAARAQVLVSPEGGSAANQAWVDEIAPVPSLNVKDPFKPQLGYLPLLRYPGDEIEMDGVVAMAHRDQPTLERPGISYFGRSIYTTFGLEGVNNGLPGATDRAELLDHFFSWLNDDPVVDIENVSTENVSGLNRFEAILPEGLDHGAMYRWDFGDGSDFTEAISSPIVGHIYDECGLYTIRVEATDAWGIKVVYEEQVQVDYCLNPTPTN